MKRIIIGLWLLHTSVTLPSDRKISEEEWAAAILLILKKPFHCQHCPRGFYTKNSYIQHQKSHAQNPRYNCEECDRSYFSLKLLEEHKNGNGKRKACRKTKKPLS